MSTNIFSWRIYREIDHWCLCYWGYDAWKQKLVETLNRTVNIYTEMAM